MEEPDSRLGGGCDVTVNIVKTEAFIVLLKKGDRGRKVEGLQESVPKFREHSA